MRLRLTVINNSFKTGRGRGIANSVHVTPGLPPNCSRPHHLIFGRKELKWQLIIELLDMNNLDRRPFHGNETGLQAFRLRP